MSDAFVEMGHDTAEDSFGGTGDDGVTQLTHQKQDGAVYGSLLTNWISEMLECLKILKKPLYTSKYTGY